jgi:hypothetical protein
MPYTVKEADEDFSKKGVGSVICFDRDGHEVCVLRSKECDEHGRFRVITSNKAAPVIKSCAFCALSGAECPIVKGGTCIQQGCRERKDYFEFDIKMTEALLETSERERYEQVYRDFVRIKCLEDELNIEPEPPKEKVVFKFSKKATAGYK